MAFKHVYDSYNRHGRFVCDTTDDIKDLPGVGETPIGSRAFVSKGGLRYILAPSGWKQIKINAGGSSGGGGGGGGGSDSDCCKVKSLENNQITSPDWLRSAETGHYYGTIDSNAEYKWPYDEPLQPGESYPVFMEVQASDEGVVFFECHSNSGEFQAIYDPSVSNTITFINIAGGTVIFEDLGDK